MTYFYSCNYSMGSPAAQWASAAVSASLDPLLIKNTVWSNGEMIHIPTNGVTLSYLSTSNGPRKVKI